MGQRAKLLVVIVAAGFAVAIGVAGCVVTRSVGGGGGFNSFGSSSDQNEIEATELAPDPADANRLAGTWTGKIKNARNQAIQIKFVRHLPGGGTSINMTSFVVDRESPLLQRDADNLHVQIVRDAGTFTIDGALRNGTGGGTLAFAADPNYVREVASLCGESIGTARAMELALADLRLDYVKAFAAAGYKFSTSDLMSLRFAGVTAEYAAGLRDAGYRFGADELRSVRFGGVDVDFAKQLRAGGYKFSADDLRSLRFAGVQPDDAVAWKQAGYDLGVDGLRSVRFAGIPAQYAKELHDGGYRFTVDDLRSLRFAGVPADYAVALKKAGYDFSADDLRSLRFAGVDADYATAAATPGKANLTADELRQLRFRGVDASTIKKLRQ